jgi:transposase
MDFTAHKAQFTATPGMPPWVLELIESAEKLSLKAQELKFENEKFKHELAHLRRMRYGAKTETLSAVNLDLFEEHFSSDAAAIAAEMEKRQEQLAAENAAKPKKPRKPTGRLPLPAHLPRTDIIHPLASCDCGQCGKPMVKIGDDITEKLHVVPAQFSVERHIRPKYACRCCETVVAAPVAPAIIDGGVATNGLLAWVAISKFMDHLPLYRLEQIAERANVPLPRSNMAEWIGKIGVALQPLLDRLVELLLQRNMLHADETPVAQLEPKSGKNKRAYIWVYRSNALEDKPPIVVFDYQPSRSGSHARNFLDKWQGHLMVDDYSGYKALFQLDITELGCMAHARRKFFDLHNANKSPVAAEALVWIAALYKVEDDAKNLGIDARRELRSKEAKPLLEKFKLWLDLAHTKAAPGSALLRAINYSLRRWPALIRYADTGHLPIDNNAAENVIRPIALGRKNWLHYGSERAGHRAAAIQSLLITAKINGLNPAAWLADVLEKLPTWPNSRIDELLPLRQAPAESLPL